MNKVGSAGGAERRSDERSKINFRIRLMRADSPEVEGVVTDLSPGGCFVESGVAVREDELIKLRLEIPAHGDLTIWGNVVFATQPFGSTRIFRRRLAES